MGGRDGSFVIIQRADLFLTESRLPSNESFYQAMQVCMFSGEIEAGQHTPKFQMTILENHIADVPL